ncbi:hypothetical protein NPIL_483151 [Nephila pilipes]|uniref:Uncharacterized protein n=1 Tax=Nephila pilipes TaxID=299642 RepID=A0A8X6P0J4_NEPPI|nr:hypothetical protein NPIL_483151 [Nephila pilipes]
MRQATINTDALDPDPILRCMPTNDLLKLDRVRSRRPSLRQTRSASVAAEMETLVSESAARTSSLRDAGRRLGLPPSPTFFIEFLISIHTNYNLAMNSCSRIP